MKCSLRIVDEPPVDVPKRFRKLNATLLAQADYLHRQKCRQSALHGRSSDTWTQAALWYELDAGTRCARCDASCVALS